MGASSIALCNHGHVHKLIVYLNLHALIEYVDISGVKGVQSRFGF